MSSLNTIQKLNNKLQLYSAVRKKRVDPKSRTSDRRSMVSRSHGLSTLKSAYRGWPFLTPGDGSPSWAIHYAVQVKPPLLGVCSARSPSLVDRHELHQQNSRPVMSARFFLPICPAKKGAYVHFTSMKWTLDLRKCTSVHFRHFGTNWSIPWCPTLENVFLNRSRISSVETMTHVPRAFIFL